jgi:FKBP-type peptidyl-prolyl cis-trans isomerase FkpA
VLVNLNIYLNDSLVNSTTRDAGGPQEIPMPPKDKVTDKIPAIFDALVNMAKGDSATIFQPVDSAMAKTIPESFGAVKEIRFEIGLKDIITEETLKARAAEEQTKAEAAMARAPEVANMVKTALADYKAKTLGDKLKKTASGLEYVIVEQGTGAAVKEGDQIPTHYLGMLKANGKQFDDSFSRGGPAPFQVGSLIPGFNEGMTLLNRGGKAVLFIPAAIAYGPQERGEIPANSDLVFYIELQ